MCSVVVPVCMHERDCLCMHYASVGSEHFVIFIQILHVKNCSHANERIMCRSVILIYPALFILHHFLLALFPESAFAKKIPKLKPYLGGCGEIELVIY